MSEKDEVLKIAKYVLECYNQEIPTNAAKEAIQACNEVLKQNDWKGFSSPWEHQVIAEALEHPAPSWQGLSDDEKLKIIRKWKDAHTMREQELIGLGDAIEQALKEKNHGA